MKRMVTFTAILFGCFLFFAFVGCSEEKEIRGGFGSDGEPVAPIKVAFTAEKSKIKIGNDLDIKLYYGSISDYNTTYACAPVSVTATLTMRSWIYEGDYQSPRLTEERLIKKIDDFTNNSYKWTSGSQDESTVGIESIIIPSEWFGGDEGCISWDVLAFIVFPSDSPLKEQSEGGGISLYYIKDNKDIILFANYYDFFHYARR